MRGKTRLHVSVFVRRENIGAYLSARAGVLCHFFCNFALRSTAGRVRCFNYQNSKEMYYVKKRIEVSLAHKLSLSYESKCCQMHGHNAIVTVYCRARELNKDGMVVDFKQLKNIVCDMLDHRYVNDVVDFNPTAENLARHICESIENCYKVSFQETEGNVACYVKDGEPDVDF